MESGVGVPPLEAEVAGGSGNVSLDLQKFKVSEARDKVKAARSVEDLDVLLGSCYNLLDNDLIGRHSIPEGEALTYRGRGLKHDPILIPLVPSLREHWSTLSPQVLRWVLPSGGLVCSFVF